MVSLVCPTFVRRHSSKDLKLEMELVKEKFYQIGAASKHESYTDEIRTNTVKIYLLLGYG
jgi:hypothetical protein